MSLTFLDFFAGVGGFRRGMEMAGHTCLGHCEIDKYANMSYKEIHQPREEEWFGTDIRRTNADELPRADVWCFGFPCQDISVAGKQLGFKGQRSSLFFTVTRLIRDTKEEDRPKYLFIENVKNLLSVNGGSDFLKLLIELDEIGYDAEWQVLNSKNFGVPQNRERVFIIGHLRGRSGRKVFPIGGTDEKDNIRKIITVGKWEGTNRHTGQRIYSINGVFSTLATKNHINDVAKIAIPVLTPNRINKRQNGRRFKESGEPMYTLTAQARHGVLIRNATSQGYLVAHPGDGIDLENPNSNTRRGRVQPQSCQTLNTSDTKGVLTQDYRIRKLTPKECWRLQGWKDEDFEKAAKVCSDSQLYKQAGNGVTVPVIYEIAKRL
ncbi:DNA cytosine methyltransferase [Clostridium paraputrificum]|uniref:DNA cytosine methyltransferase n=1 Tax=Clostridium paraputrificum TaxID=29363 RepID=UPI00232F5E9D|nr:DNA cytosine methyltransferase [Clostridium paraputrificum]MDB2122286.1 DNA cytosine methyltransferase [Clostridium paraputrificum]